MSDFYDARFLGADEDWFDGAHPTPDAPAVPPSETDPMTLADWLLEQIAEDEAVAREFDACEWAGVDAWGDGTDFFYGDNAPASVARVLAECAAKRRIVAQATAWEEMDLDSERVAGAVNALRPAILALAQPYADRPGWRSEWEL